jgi:tyrosine-protein phosphatase non-receptor type 12/18/22
MSSEYNLLPNVNCQKEKNLFTIALAKKESNRYPDILPYDSTIVKLPNIPRDHFYEGEENLEFPYINANDVRVDENGSSIILTQAPMPYTVDIFWWMILQREIKIIGMFTNVFENEKCKSVTYWPKTQNKIMYVLGGKLKITNISTNTLFPLEESNPLNMTISELVLEYMNKKHIVLHYHYKRWPDHGVPVNGSSLEILEFIKSMHNYYLGVDSNSNKTPFVIHCSAGCGRAGVICATFRRILTKESSFDAVKMIRRDRPNLVQSSEQYKYISLLVENYYASF